MSDFARLFAVFRLHQMCQSCNNNLVQVKHICPHHASLLMLFGWAACRSANQHADESAGLVCGGQEANVQ